MFFISLLFHLKFRDVPLGIYIIKGYMYVYLSVCLLPMAGRTAGPIKTKLGIGTHVDPGSVLVLTEARKGRENASAKRDR